MDLTLERLSVRDKHSAPLRYSTASILLATDCTVKGNRLRGYIVNCSFPARSSAFNGYIDHHLVLPKERAQRDGI